MDRLSNPRRSIIGDREAYFWDVVVDDVPHELVWWVTDGTLHWSYPVDGCRRSGFVKLGPRYSPRFSLADASRTVGQWARCQRERMAS